MRRRLLRTVLVISVLAIISSCANFGYYAQSVGGQMGILNRQQPIENLLADSRTSPDLGARLRAVLRMRDYASKQLGLPDNDSYRYYADLQRPFVVWNVFATEEFSTQLETWCFPVAGCVGYRGYFSEADANDYADGLRARGYDVTVKGIAAYSTLGWLQDPVLNTVLNRGEPDLAGLLFHELAHQVVYVRNDSTFNESFATTVELEGVRRWLRDNGGDSKIAAWEEAHARRADFVALLKRYRERLDGLYHQADLSAAEKRRAKSALFDALKREYHETKARWGGYAGYDRFFASDLNNASLASVAAYTDLVPAFQQLLAENKGDMTAFYQAVKTVGRLSKAQRRAHLQSIATTPATADQLATSYSSAPAERGAR